MPVAISLLVYALAVARVTRLINADRITEAPRRWLSIRLWAPKIDEATARAKFPRMLEAQGLRYTQRVIARDRYDDEADPPLLVYLLTCPWCASMYVGAVAAPIVYFWGESPWLIVPALALAFSHVTGLLATKNGE
jgi:hypothetical protein